MKLLSYAGKFVGAMVGPVLLSLYYVTGTVLELIYLLLLIPVATVSHFKAKYLNRRLQNKSILASLLLTMTVSVIAYPFKLLLPVILLAISIADAIIKMPFKIISKFF